MDERELREFVQDIERSAERIAAKTQRGNMVDVFAVHGHANDILEAIRRKRMHGELPR